MTRVRATSFRQEELDYVCFVPLIGAQGWTDDKAAQLSEEDVHTPEMAAPCYPGETP